MQYFYDCLFFYLSSLDWMCQQYYHNAIWISYKLSMHFDHKYQCNIYLTTQIYIYLNLSTALKFINYKSICRSIMRNLVVNRNSEYYADRKDRKGSSQPHFHQQSSLDYHNAYKLPYTQKQNPHQGIQKISIHQKINDVMRICKGSHPKLKNLTDKETKENNQNVLTFRQQPTRKNNHVNPQSLNKSKFMQTKNIRTGQRELSASEKKTLTIIDTLQQRAIEQIAKLQKEKNKLVELLSIEVTQKQIQKNKRVWLEKQFKKILAILQSQGIKPNTNWKQYHDIQSQKDNEISKLSRIPQKSFNSAIENPINSPQLLIKNIKQYNPQRNKQIFQESEYPYFENMPSPLHNYKIHNQNNQNYNPSFLPAKTASPQNYHESLLKLQQQLQQLQKLAQYYKQNYQHLKAIKIQQDDASKRQIGKLLNAGNEIRQDVINILQPVTLSTNSKYFGGVDSRYDKVSPYFNTRNDHRRIPSYYQQFNNHRYSSKQQMKNVRMTLD